MTGEMKISWSIIFQFGIWVSSVAYTFIYNLPDLWPGATGWAMGYKITQFIIVMVTGMFLCFILLSERGKNRSFLFFMTLIFTIASLLSGISYICLLLAWSCQYTPNLSKIIGSEYLPETVIYIQNHPEIKTCSQLILNSGGMTNTIWPREEIVSHAIILLFSYMTVSIFVVLAILSISRLMQISR